MVAFVLGWRYGQKIGNPGTMKYRGVAKPKSYMMIENKNQELRGGFPKIL
jgi:predicted phosphodiesterase